MPLLDSYYYVSATTRMVCTVNVNRRIKDYMIVPSMQVYLYINEISSPSPARTRPRVWIAEPGNLPTNQQCPGYVLHSHVYDVTMAFTLHLTVHIALTVTDVWVQQFAVNNRTLVNRMIAVLL